MNTFLTPSPSSSRPGSAASNRLSVEEQVPRPGTSRQEDSHLTQDNVPVKSLPLIFQRLKTYFNSGKVNGKVMCKIFNKEITQSVTSNYNIKSHYKRWYRGEYPNLRTALSVADTHFNHLVAGKYKLNIYIIYCLNYLNI